MQLTLVTRECFRFINLIRLFIIAYEIFLTRTHVKFRKKTDETSIFRN